MNLMQIRYVFSVLLFTIFSPYILVNAQSLSKDRNGLLWKISGNGLKENSFLFGTMHNVEGDFVYKVNGLMDIISSAKYVAIESDIRAFRRYVKGEFYYMPKDTTYAMIYEDREKYLYVDSVLKQTDAQYGVLKPKAWESSLKWLNIFSTNSAHKEVGSFVGLDVWIHIAADALGKELFYLEDENEVFARTATCDSIYFSAYSLSEQAEDLYNFLSTASDTTESVYGWELERIYRSQDLNKLTELYLQTTTLIGSSDKRSMIPVRYLIDMIKPRNYRMLDVIHNYIHKGSALIAVGAFHLVGEDGLITLLRKRGYCVEAVTKFK